MLGVLIRGNDQDIHPGATNSQMTPVGAWVVLTLPLKSLASMRSIRRVPNPRFVGGRLFDFGAAAFFPDEAKARIGIAALRPGNVDRSRRGDQRAVFDGVGRKLVDRQRQPERLTRPQIKIGTTDINSIASGPVRRQSAFDDFPNRRAGPSRPGQEIMRPRERDQPIGKGLANFRVCVALHGLVRNRADGGERVLDAMLEFLGQQQLPLRRILQCGRRFIPW